MPPARAVLGVAGLPDHRIEINAVASAESIGDAAGLSAELQVRGAFSPGILTHDRLFISALPVLPCRVPALLATRFWTIGSPGRLRPRPNESCRRAAGLGPRSRVFVNPYLTRNFRCGS